MSARSAVALAVSVVFVVAAPIRPAFAAPTADLRADVNRDGVLTRADDAAEERWTNRRGAIVLPNLDDDQSRCPKLRPDGLPLADDVLPTCHDAADTVVNGQTDLADLARLRVEPIAGLPDSAHVTVKAGPRARLYVRRGDGWAALPATGELTAAEARHGVDLAIEATDIVRDLAVWNGMVDVMVNLVMRTTATSDRVRLRVAPLLIQHDLMTVQRMMVADRRTDPLAKGTEVRRDILGRPMATPRSTDPLTEEEEFRRDLRAGLDSAGLTKPFIEHPVGGFEGDIWVQDQFEAAYASMPAAGGGEHRIRIYVRSANLSRFFTDPVTPLRTAGRPVFLKYRGPNVAGIQQYDPSRIGNDDALHTDTFSSTGNFGALPPYSHAGKRYPAGRIVYGAAGFWSPDPTFTKMLQAQGFQKPLVLDTSWLLVGHIDEFMVTLPAKTKRGWVVAVADPMLGEKLLSNLVAKGQGEIPIFNDVPPDPFGAPIPTVTQVLRDPRIREANRIAARGIDQAVAKLRAETGLTPREIVHLPALFDSFTSDDDSRSLTFAYVPGVANGIGTGTSTYLAPKQHGPRDRGEDVFERTTEAALAKHGIRVAWVEDWAYSHVGFGEIHCVTNTERDLSKTDPWWNEQR